MIHRSYFDGRVQSLVLRTPAGLATVGVITPGTFTFDAVEEERVRVLSGTLRVRLPDRQWTSVGPGQMYVVAAGQRFEVETHEDVGYICHFVPPGGPS